MNKVRNGYRQIGGSQVLPSKGTNLIFLDEQRWWCEATDRRWTRYAVEIFVGESSYGTDYFDRVQDAVGRALELAQLPLPGSCEVHRRTLECIQRDPF